MLHIPLVNNDCMKEKSLRPLDHTVLNRAVSAEVRERRNAGVMFLERRNCGHRSGSVWRGTLMVQLDPAGIEGASVTHK